jgi:hypothetical protein
MPYMYAFAGLLVLKRAMVMAIFFRAFRGVSYIAAS